LEAQIGIIGGSGLYSMPGFEAQQERTIETPWGRPSDSYVLGTLAGKRLAFLARRKQIVTPSEAVTARLLVSLAHDWALGSVLSPGSPPHRARELEAMVDVVWEGLRAR